LFAELIDKVVVLASPNPSLDYTTARIRSTPMTGINAENNRPDRQFVRRKTLEMFGPRFQRSLGADPLLIK